MQQVTNRIDSFVSNNCILRFITSFLPMMVCYGAYLMLYDLVFMRQIIPSFHPFLIVWAGIVAAYSLFIRQDWKKINGWPFLALFAVSVLITAVLNFNLGVVDAIKASVLTLLPLVAFLPYLVSAPAEKRQKRFFAALAAPVIIIFICSAVAVIMYLIHYQAVVEFFGVTVRVGIQQYPAGENVITILRGLYVDSNHSSLYAIVAAIYSVALYSACKKGLFSRPWCNRAGKIFAITNLIVQCLFFPLANSRGGWLSLGVTLVMITFLYLFFRQKNSGVFKRFILSSVGAVASLAVVMSLLIGARYLCSYSAVGIQQLSCWEDSGDVSSKPEEPSQGGALDDFDKPSDNGGSGRIKIWQEAFHLYLKSPLFGENPGNTDHFASLHLPGGKLSFGSALHNSYLDLLISYGAVGFLLLIAFLIACVVLAIIKIATRYFDDFPSYAIVGICLFLACGSFFLSNVFINTTITYFLLLTAMGYLVIKETE